MVGILLWQLLSLYLLHDLFVLAISLPDPIVQTAQGTVQGQWSKPIHNLSFVGEFLGIPFAEPPVGKLRWQPAMRPSKLNGTLHAINQPKPCAQGGDNFTDSSEDCLYLNVYTPTLVNTTQFKQTGKEEEDLLPVVVWYYGGGSMEGSATDYGPLQNLIGLDDGAYLLVIPQYRLTVFGYLTLSELAQIDPRKTSGNYGITDCIMALEWVQENIAAFGGDPSRVTVLGQSSGGTQILGMLAAPSAKGLFASAISLSGSPNITMDINTAQDHGRSWLENTVCHKYTSTQDILNCMYELNLSDVIAAVPPNTWEAPYLNPLTPKDPLYYGVVVVDGVTIALPLLEAVQVPIVDATFVLASMQAEDGGWVNKSLGGMSRDELNTYFTERYTMENGWDKATASDVLSTYDVYNHSAAEAYTTFCADLGVTCPNIELATAASSSFSKPVYLVYNTQAPANAFTFKGDDEDEPATLPFHMFDIITAAETYSHYSSSYIPQQSDKDMGAYLRQAWREIYETGNTSTFTRVNHVEGYVTNVVNTLHGGGPQINYRNNVCKMLRDHDFLTGRSTWVN